MSDVIDAYFDSNFYLEKYSDIAKGGIDPLQHYKDHGWRERRWPAPWFDPNSYRERFPDSTVWEADPFEHFIATGDVEEARAAHDLAKKSIKQPNPKGLVVSNTRLALENDVYQIQSPKGEDLKAVAPFFDADFYTTTYPDIAGKLIDPLLHFMTIGWVEGRDPSPDFSVRRYLLENKDIRQARINPFVHYCKHGRNERWRRAVGIAEAAVLDAFENDERLVAAVQDAIELEPMVALPDGKRVIGILPHTHKKIAAAARELRLAHAGKSYDYVVLVPHIRMSGAARVSSIFSRILREVVGKDVLVVCTDSSEAEYQHWFPDNCDLFDGSAILQSVEGSLRTQLLYDLLRGVGAKAVFNINSRLAWDMTEEYGRQISQEFKIFTYLFTWDETVNGARVGYPIQWLRNTSGYHHTIFTDNEMLANDVRTRFGYDDEKCSVVSLRTPAENFGIDAGTPVNSTRRPVFLWAGRFDRQKYTELLVSIARALPQAQFHIYGKSVLDRQQQLTADKLPENCVLKGTYKELADVFEMDDYTGFLYTAKWDGIPTILLDIGTTGLPIIASDVGGISELVTENTGWLVNPFDEVDAYVNIMKYVAANPEEAKERASAMKDHLATAFSEAKYSNAIKEALARHDL